MQNAAQQVPVLVTTQYRGVFFGFLESREGDSVVLSRARCAIRWATTGGFLELAKDGPNENSKIGSEAERITLFGVTSIAEVSAKAVEKWLAA